MTNTLESAAIRAPADDNYGVTSSEARHVSDYFNLCSRIFERLERRKDTLSAVQSIATIVALVIGGVWTIRNLEWRREAYPHAKVEHRLQAVKVKDGILLGVDVVITNIGTVLLDLESEDFRVYAVSPPITPIAAPLPSTASVVDGLGMTSPWKMLGAASKEFSENRFIEPGETDVLHFEVLAAENMDVVAIYTFVPNVKSKQEDKGWEATTLYDIKHALQKIDDRKDYVSR